MIAIPTLSFMPISESGVDTDMEKLNSKSLMIGDWVSVKSCSKPNFYKVSKLDPNRESSVYPIHVERPAEGLSYTFLDEDEIEPIPLTAEILEKNGFVDCHTIGEKFELRIHLDKDNYQVVSYYFGLAALSIKTEYSYSLSPTIDRLRIKYVHELQHALKLCKINKEVVL